MILTLRDPLKPSSRKPHLAMFTNSNPLYHDPYTISMKFSVLKDCLKPVSKSHVSPNFVLHRPPHPPPERLLKHCQSSVLLYLMRNKFSFVSSRDYFGDVNSKPLFDNLGGPLRSDQDITLLQSKTGLQSGNRTIL